MISFKVLRLLYSRLFGQVYFSAKFDNREHILKVTTVMTSFSIITLEAVSAGVAAYILFLKNKKDQTFLSAIETILISAVCGVVLLIDTCWQPEDSYMEGNMS